MALLSAVDLAKSYGPVDIFSGITLSIPHGARIAIVGPNGIGKTTLLRILLGLEEPTEGSVHKARSLTTGYLAQEAHLDGSHTLWDECLAAISELQTLENELARLEAAMSDPVQAEETLERYGKLQAEFERRGGYTYETRIRQTLTGLGFEPIDFNRPIPQLSGGQRTRAVLARLLLSDPELLILDEPTNHLDITAVEWLEGYLSQWQGATLIVSHDRYFLDKVVDHIWEMSASGMEVYRGNYSHYVQQRQERWDLRQQIFEDQKQRLLKDLDYVKRNISGQNVQQAKGRLRRLSREVQAFEQLGAEALQNQSWLETSSQTSIASHPMSVDEVEHRIRALKGPRNRPPHLRLNLKASLRSGDLVLRTRDLAIGYEDEGRPLFRAPDLLLKRGECAAVIGPNGAGKTTFLKTLLEHLPPLEGEVILGASLHIGYFAQAHEDLRPERTLVEEIDAVAPNLLLAEVRDYLARFLFSGEDVFKKVSVLSGGERGRLALAKLSLTRANLLLLDEPTNHLDIPSQEILQEVLADYQGTILLVSHDRYLIDALGTQIWEIVPGQAALQVFEGTYSQYRAEQDKRQLEQALKSAGQREAGIQHRVRPGSLAPEVRRARSRITEVEGLISALEEELASISRKLEHPPDDPAKVLRLGRDYVRLQNELDELMKEWEQLHLSLAVE
ncbi:MAG: ABC-F family ATP-binding cassette domain-containing protein [Anaerolineales bacterium]|nr:ABC-F family ATP-binding cassette domain-containing protein [Anaerolineales bacterium]